MYFPVLSLMMLYSFTHAVPLNQNDLPCLIHLADSSLLLKTLLKQHLFYEIFPDQNILSPSSGPTTQNTYLQNIIRTL